MAGTDHSGDFHDFRGATYLNCAFHGAMPRVAVAAVESALELKKAPHRIRDEHHFSFPDAYRSAVARLIGADSADVAIANSATHGIMILAAGLDWRAGDEVVLPRGEFPANLFPWRALAARSVRVREIDLPAAGAAERLDAALTERTRVVSLSWVDYATGRRYDLAALGQLCRERGVLLSIDGSQGVGSLPFSVAEIPCDLVACAGYKWLLGPYGTGFAWVRPEIVARLAVSNVNWFSLAGARDFSRLSDCRLEYSPGARRFDVNEPGNFLNMAGAAAAVEYLLGVGIDEVARHAGTLLERLVAGLPAGMRSLAEADPRHRSNILCIAPGSKRQNAALSEALGRRRIHISRREGAVRVSPHVYNTREDVDRLLDALDEAVAAP